jgi:hypothetical protein
VNSVELVPMFNEKLNSITLMELKWVLRLGFDIYTYNIKARPNISSGTSPCTAVQIQ